MNHCEASRTGRFLIEAVTGRRYARAPHKKPEPDGSLRRRGSPRPTTGFAEARIRKPIAVARLGGECRAAGAAEAVAPSFGSLFAERIVRALGLRWNRGDPF